MIPSRDRHAFDEFVAASADRLVRTAYLLCGDRGHAEDLVQTALLRTARRWRTARRQPEAYARRVVVNLAKDRWRDLARRPAESPLDGAERAGTVGVIDGLPDGVRPVDVPAPSKAWVGTDPRSGEVAIYLKAPSRFDGRLFGVSSPSLSEDQMITFLHTGVS
jgi:DNA-directed RNA polymerase specialized sigma24 family protein